MYVFVDNSCPKGEETAGKRERIKAGLLNTRGYRLSACVRTRVACSSTEKVPAPLAPES